MWNLCIFSPKSKGYLKNHCTNHTAQLFVCTHLNAFFVAESIYGKEIWIFAILGEKIDDIGTPISIMERVTIKQVNFANFAEGPNSQN